MDKVKNKLDMINDAIDAILALESEGLMRDAMRGALAKLRDLAHEYSFLED